MATPGSTSLLVYEILVKSQQASAELKKFGVDVDVTAQKAVLAKKLIMAASRELGIGFKEAAQVVGKFNPMLGLTQKELNGVAGGMENVGNRGTGAFSKVLSATNTLNITFGILASTLIRNVLGAIQQFFQGAIKNATEYEDTLFRLTNVERELSNAGVPVTMAGLKKGIQDIKKLLPIFSREDIASLVGKVAISTKDLRYTEQQILDLSKAIGILNVRSTESETLNQTSSKVITALLSGTTKGVSNLGIQLDNSTIKLQAMKDGFLRAGESVDSLTKQEKGIVKLNVILASVNGELETLDEYMSTNSAKLQENAAAWKDLQTTIGQLLTPFIPALTDAIDALTQSMDSLKLVLSFVFTGLSTFVIILKAAREGIKLTKDEIKGINEGFMKDFLNTFFKEAPSNVNEGSFLDKLFKKYLKPPKETDLGIASAIAEEEEKAKEAAKKMGEKLAEIMQDNVDKLADIERDYQRKKADIATDYGQKLADIARDTARKREDADRDYGQKVEDINRTANEKIAEAQANFRQKEIDREAEYQNKLRELREKFLFSLEDALRERDARQVLRLIRQYNLDKKNLEERRKLQKKDDDQELQRKIADIERERILKLEAAKRDYDEKLQEIKRGEARARAEAQRWQQRALADARLHYQRQLADQREFLKRKLADLQAAYAQELSMANQFQNSLPSGGGATTTTASQFKPFSSTPSGGIGSGLYNPYDVRTIYKQLGIPGFANGGTLIARKPTLALFGEKSPEVASFQPINKGGFSANFGGAGGGGGGGQMSLRISLSEGLVAEIIENSLDKMATHLDRTRRSSQ